MDRQREDCADLASRRGWSTTEYRDNDISAAGKAKRPGFRRLLEDVQARRVDVIVAWTLDRIVRNARDRLALVEACKAANVSVALVKGSDMDLATAAGRLLLGLLGEVAQHEIDVKSERQKRQVLQAAKAGLPAGGPRAFGYEAGGREPHPTEGPVVAELYRRFLAGSGLGELTDWLNRQGLSTPKGARWRSGSVKVVLANPRNAGLRGLRPVVNEHTGRRSVWHEIVAPATWDAVVDETTWRAAVAILQDPNRPGRNDGRPKGPHFQHLLSGIATCGRCGLHMISSSGAGHRTYRCSSKMHIVRRAEHIDRYVEYVVATRLRRPDAVDLLGGSAGLGEIEQLRDQALALRGVLNKLAADFADLGLDWEQVKVAGERARSNLAAVNTRIAELGSVDVLAPLVLADDEEVMTAVWRGYPLGTRRVVLQRLCSQIVVFRGKHGRPLRGEGFDPATVRIVFA